MQNNNAKFKVEFKKRLYAYTLRLVRYIETLPKDSVGRTIGNNQLMRSGTSILANYVEAQAASSKKDFINFFNHALKSANETKMWLTLLRDLKKGSHKEAMWPLQETTEIGNILATSILTMKGKR